ncbi:hypothetical protein HHI36_007996 [Cryptolaemus montrouzieri]|uniref:Uncharacterized protein n=1 Tax=Cryptolaemus montrouzieri TaxID=559131 RepID=A0ABD2MRN7_9CUCU
MDHDFEINLNIPKENEERMFDSLEIDSRNIWVREFETIAKSSDMAVSKLENIFPSPDDKIQFALENIKILNEIQRKIHKINNLVDVFKKNMTRGKVHALSSMYESFQSSQSYYNDLTNLQATPIKLRRRNLSLPTFVERRLNYEPKILNVEKERDVVERKEEIQAVEVSFSQCTYFLHVGNLQYLVIRGGRILELIVVLKNYYFTFIFEFIKRWQGIKLFQYY